jgi:hypothetical protein
MNVVFIGEALVVVVVVLVVVVVVAAVAAVAVVVVKFLNVGLCHHCHQHL